MASFQIKLLLPVLAATLLSVSCGSSKNATVSATRNDVKGNWVLDNISYQGLSAGEKLKITLLDEGSEDCLKGSTWVLPNNGNGSYTIASNGAAGCIAGQKNIVWSYRTEGDQAYFQFKKLTGGDKAKNIEEGYRFKIVSATDNALALQSEVSYQGNPILINYSFTKQ